MEEISRRHISHILEALVPLIDGQELARAKPLQHITLGLRAVHRMGGINLRSPEMHRAWHHRERLAVWE